VAVAPGLARYTAVSVLGFVLNVAIMAIVTRVLALDYRIGLALVVLIIPVTNFTLNARWTFRH
jgi:putative flippase GtrA